MIIILLVIGAFATVATLGLVVDSLDKIGHRRIERLELELQAMHGQVVSELRAAAYYDA